jgi:Tfp pilus assembly protein PilX
MTTGPQIADADLFRDERAAEPGKRRPAEAARSPLHQALDRFGKACDARQRHLSIVEQAHERLPALDREIEEAVAELAELGVPVAPGRSRKSTPPRGTRRTTRQAELVLEAIPATGGRVAEIAARSGVANQSASTVLNTLKHKGLVRRDDAGNWHRTESTTGGNGEH